ncbi:MAG: DAK2 domain-containing protein [Bacillota bacterium]
MAAHDAQQGADETREMVAQQGRAKFLGKRSKGFHDAGACSVALIFKVMAEKLPLPY